MNTAKKLDFFDLPQDFSPKKLPDIIKLVKNMKEDGALIYQNKNKPFLFETKSLVIRPFYEEDGEAVCILAREKEASPMKERDHTWPTDSDSCIEIAKWFSTQENMWAVCIKPSFELIGMITFNTVDKDNKADIGHVWRTSYQNGGLDTEALSLMVQYAFENLEADCVYAYNPLDYEPQIRPLKEIGMEVTEQSTASFIKDESGDPIEFTACKMEITKERWNRK